MSELTERLRAAYIGRWWPELGEAADRIEALEAQAANNELMCVRSDELLAAERALADQLAGVLSRAVVYTNTTGTALLRDRTAALTAYRAARTQGGDQ